MVMHYLEEPIPSIPKKESCIWYNEKGLCRWQRVARFSREKLECPCNKFEVKEKEIVLNWNNDGHGTRTDKEREEAESDWEKNKDTTYHYPVRRA